MDRVLKTLGSISTLVLSRAAAPLCLSCRFLRSRLLVGAAVSALNQYLPGLAVGTRLRIAVRNHPLLTTPAHATQPLFQLPKHFTGQNLGEDPSSTVQQRKERSPTDKKSGNSFRSHQHEVLVLFVPFVLASGVGCRRRRAIVCACACVCVWRTDVPAASRALPLIDSIMQLVRLSKAGIRSRHPKLSDVAPVDVPI